MTFVDGIGYASAAVGILIFAMQTMIPLRVAGIVHNIGQITFGLLCGSYPMVAQHVILLPLNCYRLFEMLRLIRQVKGVSAGEHSMDWLKPFMSKRFAKSGEILFRKGDEADQMFYLLEGKLKVVEIDVTIGRGAVVGELGMLAPDNKRTQTVVCVEDARLLQISYERIEEIYFQNPTFGFYFLRLSSARLFDNIARLESELAARDREIARLKALPAH